MDFLKDFGVATGTRPTGNVGTTVTTNSSTGHIAITVPAMEIIGAVSGSRVVVGYVGGAVQSDLVTNEGKLMYISLGTKSNLEKLREEYAAANVNNAVHHSDEDKAYNKAQREWAVAELAARNLANTQAFGSKLSLTGTSGTVSSENAWQNMGGSNESKSRFNVVPCAGFAFYQDGTAKTFTAETVGEVADAAAYGIATTDRKNPIRIVGTAEEALAEGQMMGLLDFKESLPVKARTAKTEDTTTQEVLGEDVAASLGDDLDLELDLDTEDLG